MEEHMQKIKLLKIYELLSRETDENHPISRMELCRRLNEMGVSSNVRTLSKDVAILQNNGYEIISFLYLSKRCRSLARHRFVFSLNHPFDGWFFIFMG